MIVKTKNNLKYVTNVAYYLTIILQINKYMLGLIGKLFRFFYVNHFTLKCLHISPIRSQLKYAKIK